VGECLVYSIQDVISLLDCCPILGGESQVVVDPTLEKSGEWERIDKKLDRDDPTLYDFFQHRETEKLFIMIRELKLTSWKRKASSLLDILCFSSGNT
jgi:hypothetical protein